jgi:hypothetical protein
MGNHQKNTREEQVKLEQEEDLEIFWGYFASSVQAQAQIIRRQTSQSALLSK